MTIREAGDYVLTIVSMGTSSLHFPFSFRSIVIEGNSYIQECIPCPPGNESFLPIVSFRNKQIELNLGTYSSTSGTSSCKSCSDNMIAPNPRSTQCTACDADEYSGLFVNCSKMFPFQIVVQLTFSDDSSTKCLPRPKCQLKDFQRRLKQCQNNQVEK